MRELWDSPLVGASSLAEIPEHRCAALLKQLRRRFPDVEDLDACIAVLASRPCPVPTSAPLAELVAGLGDDGRYHLVVDAALSCGSRKVRRRLRVLDGRLPNVDVVFPHTQLCNSWSDGTRYLVQPPYGAPYVREHLAARVVGWDVRLTGAVLDPELVHPRQRCATTTNGPLLSQWPPFIDSTTPKGRIRARLVDELGPACHVCRAGRGVFIDHQHDATRLVRGLVCRHCNSKVDGCLHLSGCRWASYLDHPPAAHLGLRYPS